MIVLSCNIGPDSWPERRELCAEVLLSRSPSIICFQEMVEEKLDYLRLALRQFDWFGTCNKPAGRNPVAAIFYLRERFERISAGSYWLSQTPHVPGSRSWDSAGTRLANWVCLEEHASGRRFRAISTHLDHFSQEARENQGRMINEDAAAYPGEYPQILAGDMNSDRENPVIRAFKEAGWQDSYEAVYGPEEAGFTLHRFAGQKYESEVGRVDWIFVRGAVHVRGAEIIRDSHDGHYPSDHYFVAADVSF